LGKTTNTKMIRKEGSIEMSDAPIELIVAAFQSETGADEALAQLKEAKRDRLIGIKDAAVIRRDEKDKVHINDVRDVSGGKGAVAGAVIGTAIALLSGPVGIVLAGATGALVGGLTAKAVDMGLPNKRLKEISTSLKPGTSAIVAIIEHTWVTQIEDAMAEAGAEVMREAIKSDIASQLEAGRDVSYSALSSDEGLAVNRTAGSEDELEISDLSLTDDGLVAQGTVVNKQGMATQALMITEDGVISGTMVASADSEEESEDEGGEEA
jgi:uncharacterized membrane protein